MFLTDNGSEVKKNIYFDLIGENKMKSLSYLNMILTLLVIVLMGNLWMGYHGSGVGQHDGFSFAQEVQAGPTKYQTPDSVRVDILKELKKSNSNHENLVRMLKSGEVQVKMVREPKPNQPKPRQ